MGFGVRRRRQGGDVGRQTGPSHDTPESRRALYLLLPLLLAWALAGGGGGCGSLAVSELVGFVPSPGTARDVAIDSAAGLAYVASSEFGLTVVDVSDPADPLAVGAPNPPLFGSNVAAQGSLVVVSGSEGMHVVDVSDPARPEAIGAISLTVAGAALSGSYAYVRLPVPGNPGHSDLGVIDLRDPTRPSLLRQIYVPGGDRVEVVGSYVYVTTGTSLAIYYIGNPGSPQLRSTIAIPGGARELAVAGNTAYVGNLSAVYSVDVSNRSSPRIVGSVVAPSTDLAVLGTRLYSLTGSQFKVIDVANPAAPRVLGTGSGFGAWALAVRGNVVWLASPDDHESGLYGVSVAVASSPQVLSGLPGAVGNSDVAASGSLAVVNASDGLHVVDVADPRLPETVGWLDVNGSGVALSGSYAYVRVQVPGNPGHSDLGVVDLRSPTAPRLVNQVYVAGGDRVVVAGSYAYVTTGPALAIYYVGNPTSPQFRGSVNIPNGARELAVSGNTAYVGNLSAVYSVDVSNRSSPRIVGSVVAPSTDLAIAGTKLFALTGTQFKVIDVSNPSAPTVLGTGNGFPSAWGIEAVGSSVFLACNEAREVVVFDVANPAQPTLVEVHSVPGDVRSVAKAQGFVYVGDATATVDVLSVGS